MSIGDKNRRVEVQTNTPTLLPGGGKEASWATTSTVWGKVINLTGRKLESARQIDIEASVAVETRFCGTDGVAGITVKNRLVYNSRILEIVHVNDIFEQHRELYITCKEQISV
jgi:SPP1 family predicted phage head-tail adaptor